MNTFITKIKTKIKSIFASIVAFFKGLFTKKSPAIIVTVPVTAPTVISTAPDVQAVLPPAAVAIQVANPGLSPITASILGSGANPNAGSILDSRTGGAAPPADDPTNRPPYPSWARLENIGTFPVTSQSFTIPEGNYELTAVFNHGNGTFTMNGVPVGPNIQPVVFPAGTYTVVLNPTYVPVQADINVIKR